MSTRTMNRLSPVDKLGAFWEQIGEAKPLREMP